MRSPRASGAGPAGTPSGTGDELPHGITAHAIGRPRRAELPLHLPWASALALGAERMHVTHGPPVLEHSTQALRAALDAPPWWP